MSTTMATEQRCQLTELIVSQCAHCRPPMPRFLAAILAEPDDDPTIVASFPARFAGRCAGSGDHWFDEGAWISRTADGDYLCSDCAT